MTWQNVPIAYTICIYRKKYNPTVWYNNRQHVKIYLTSYCMQLLTFQCETAALCLYVFALQWGNVVAGTTGEEGICRPNIFSFHAISPKLQVNSQC